MTIDHRGIHSPRLLLWLIAIEYAIVGWQTTAYPPSYLYLAPAWAALSIVAAAFCLAAAIHPSRTAVASAGSLVVTVAAIRSVAITQEAMTRTFGTTEEKASFVIAASLWVFVAVLLHGAFREYVLPWAVSNRRGGDGLGDVAR